MATTALLVTLVLVLTLLAVTEGQLSSGQTSDDLVFAYSQVMTNCVGQQFTDHQNVRLMTAARRCEQVHALPLRDSALQVLINQLQNARGSQQLLYVPVSVNPGFSALNSIGGGGLGSLGVGGGSIGTLGGFGSGLGIPTFNQFTPIGGSGRNPGLNPQYNLGGLTVTQAAFDRVGFDNNLGVPLGTVLGTNQGSANTFTTDDIRNSNPFGFNFSPVGKQTSEGLHAAAPATVLVPDTETNSQKSDGSGPLKRKTRQINTFREQQIRFEALNYLSNMTCVLREAGMIDHNNLPNYQNFESELRRQQVSRDLRNDLSSGLTFCKELTQCMPVERLNHPLARELGQAIAYFRCVARTNMKACKKEDERRNLANPRVSGSNLFFSGNGFDLLKSVLELAISDDALGFDFF